MTNLLIALLGIAAVCGANQPAEQQGAPAQRTLSQTDTPLLDDTYWKLAALGTLTPVLSPGAREPHLVFHAGGSVTGSDGCNSIRTGYTVNGDAMKFSALMGTLINCTLPENLDRKFREVLVITTSWKIVDGELRLLGDAGTVLARFEPRFDR